MAASGPFKTLWFNQKPIEMIPSNDYHSRPSTINFRQNTVYIYNPLTFVVKTIMLYGDGYSNGLHIPTIDPGLGIMSFCEIQDKYVGYHHLSIVGKHKQYCLIPLTPGRNHKQVFIVSINSTTPSLKDQCIASLINSSPGKPTMADLGKRLQQVPLPSSLIEDVCNLQPKFLNEGIGNQNPIFKELRPCKNCLSILKNNGILPSHIDNTNVNI
jgi:hypothetical protein